MLLLLSLGIVVLTSDAGLVGNADDAHAVVGVGGDFACAASAVTILVGEIVTRRGIEVLRVHVIRGPKEKTTRVSRSTEVPELQDVPQLNR